MKEKKDLVFSADYIYTPGWIVKFQPKLQTSAIHPLSKPLNFRFKKTLNHNSSFTCANLINCYVMLKLHEDLNC